jgi:DNA mismatch repair ATPase MutS
VWTRDFAVPLVERQLSVRNLEGYGLDTHPAAAIAAGAVLHYVRTTQKNEALHVDSLKLSGALNLLELDQVTVRNLELVEPLFSGQDVARHALPHAGRMPDADGQAPAARYHPAAARSDAEALSKPAMKP